MTEKRILRTDSSQPTPTAAINEIEKKLQFDNSSLTVFFCSPEYDRDELQKQISQRAGSQNVIGCTSAGEIGLSGYQNRSISGFSLNKDEFKVSIRSISKLKDFTVDQGREMISSMLGDLATQGIQSDYTKCFALLLVDGLSVAEEPLTYKLQEALHGIPLIGGSAGDGLNFKQTGVYSNGKFRSDNAVLAIIHSERPWEAFKEQNLEPTEKKLVVTEADPENRIVIELNGEPAAEELARVIGLNSPEELTKAVLAENPLMLKFGGHWYVRSAHTVNKDNSLSIFCAIEEGLVLSVGKASDLSESLDDTLQEIRSRLGDISLTIACDCILRRLELEGNDDVEKASAVLNQANAIGFSTYGEQFGTVHVNQTLTGIAIG